jgi:hypothetical protein
VRAEPVIRSARARGGCRAHAGRVRPAACSFRISVRSAWSLHHSDTPELSLGNAICNRAEVEGMCELLHTSDVFWPSSGDPPPRGTDGSNPSPSSGESVANSVFPKAGPRASFRRQHHHRSHTTARRSAPFSSSSDAVMFSSPPCLGHMILRSASDSTREACSSRCSYFTFGIEVPTATAGI